MSRNLTRRQDAASAKAAGALSLFQKAAEELETAASQHEAVSAQADDLADQYNTISLQSAAAGAKARSHAQKLRDLFGSAA